MANLGKLVDNMMEYGRAKELYRLFREKSRQTIMYSMLLGVDESKTLRQQGELVRKMVLTGDVERFGTLIEIDRKEGTIIPLLMSQAVYAVENFGDLLYDANSPTIEMGTRIHDRQVDDYLDVQLQDRKLYILKGRNPDIESVNSKYMRQVLRKRS